MTQGGNSATKLVIPFTGAALVSCPHPTGERRRAPSHREAEKAVRLGMYNWQLMGSLKTSRIHPVLRKAMPQIIARLGQRFGLTREQW
jgi:hypothetical protein